ncbi:MAG: SIR2 family protein [Paludibacteraceae bacterium]|nr:SIR2 family protein [Paludibacteraceae bacterium]
MEKQQFNDILAIIPESFKAKLERIRRYLQLGKASVMVGAGFSRNANFPSHVKIKQWTDVGEDIYCHLMSIEKADPSKLEFKTPMRLASQFAATFGRNELDNLIRDSIPDDKMSPGLLHRQLLSLPWRDVFTTNYDTLLERSRKGLLRTYSVVTSKEMLLYKKSPRIIKLHGSFPDQTPFLMTEEDFRTYPSDHPEFVNTVRQALVESIFCLIGFSGDDPNFTSWQGWLRDVMGDYAGPSYLIACDKDYDESFKTLMNYRGIHVLNFAEIPGLHSNKTALDFFFTYLSERDGDWCGSAEYDTRTVNARELTGQLKKIRQTYPGWFILPKIYLEEFNDMYRFFPFLDTAFKTLEKNDKEPLLYELDWRANISLTFKDFDWYREELELLIKDYGDNPLTNEAITLGISLLRLYRHHPEKNNEAETLEERLSREKDRMTEYQHNCYLYTVACNSLSVLDYDKVIDTLSKWDISYSDYTGVIYKSLVLGESGELSAAMELLNEAFERITQSLTQTSTQEELSLRCVIENLLAFYSGERMPNNDPRFSFVNLSDYIHQQAAKAKRKPFEIQHGFGVGASHKSWHIGSGTNSELLYPYRYLLLCERYGLPYGITSSSIFENILADYLPMLSAFGLGYSIGVVLRSGSRDLVKAYMSRKTLTLLSREQADKLANQLLAVSKQNSCERARKNKEVSVLLPFLARLSSSCSVPVVINIFKFALPNYRKSFFVKPEDLNIIYDNVLPEGIQSVYEFAFSSEVFKDVREHDIPLPHTGLSFYSPGDKEIDIVCNGLDSDDVQFRRLAYRRAELLLRSDISVERKNILFEQIRLWRAKEERNRQTRASYLIVTPTDNEKPLLLKQIKVDLDIFLEKDYKYEGSSTVVSMLESDLNHIVYGVEYLTKGQICSVLNKLVDVFKVNFASFSEDDSNEMMGGLRHFTFGVFKQTEEFVRLAYNNRFDDRSSSVLLFKELCKYLSSHLPVRLSIEHLNQIARVLKANKIRDILEENLFSDNEEDVIDSCKGLISYIQHSNNYQKILQRIIFFCNYAETDQIRIYLQMLAQIPIEKMSKSTTQEYLAEMMKLLQERITKKNLSEEQKVDIMHYGVCLAANLRKAPAGSAIADAVKIWEEYANNDGVYNDIRRPWFLKKDDDDDN